MQKYNLIDNKKVNSITSDPVVNLALHTIIDLKKQVLVFNNSKRSSEANAEKIANAVKKVDFSDELEQISNKILKTFSTPTKQCIRLSKCVKKGIAFHHSGLVAKQRDLVEKGFKEGFIKLISSTPTLAAGLNMPAYIVIIKDYKRYSSRGFNDIPILEYHQMAGRAGRPGHEKIGKTVLCVANENERDRIVDKYLYGEPEEIISKLAVEPTLKMYILSLIAMDLINTKKEIKTFFSNTLYAKQYQDLEALNYNLFRIIDILIDYGFINQDDDYFVATKLGKKISELYLNPDTANYFLEHVDNFFKIFAKINYSKSDIYSFIHFLVLSNEMKPLFRVRKIEENVYTSKIENTQDFLEIKFDPFEDDFENYLASIKTTDIIMDWMNESHEDFITEKYKITPGELNYKIDILDWLLYSIEEISLMKKNIYFKHIIKKIRIRLKNGIKDELLDLVSIKGIGRIRARKLFDSGIRDLSDLKVISIDKLKTILSDKLAEKIKMELSSGFVNIDNLISKKPKEVELRNPMDVEDVEVIDLVNNYNEFEKEKKESQMSLDNFF